MVLRLISVCIICMLVSACIWKTTPARDFCSLGSLILPIKPKRSDHIQTIRRVGMANDLFEEECLDE